MINSDPGSILVFSLPASQLKPAGRFQQDKVFLDAEQQTERLIWMTHNCTWLYSTSFFCESPKWALIDSIKILKKNPSSFNDAAGSDPSEERQCGIHSVID